MSKSERSRRRFLGQTASAAAGVLMGAAADAEAAQTTSQRSTTARREGGGTLLRGADGRLYLVPDGGLDAFRLPDSKAALVARAELTEAAQVCRDVSALKKSASKRIGLISGDNDNTMIVVNIGAIRKRYD